MTSEDIEFLKNHNKWRRGDEKLEQTDPIELGKIIDRIVAHHETNYDSTIDTMKHINRVSELIYSGITIMMTRASEHDKSKLESPEKEAFDSETPKLKDLKFGNEEYNSSLRILKHALDHHYRHNTHHPQFYDIYKCPNCGEKTTIHDTWLHSGTIEANRFHNCTEHAIFEIELTDDDIISHGINQMNLFDIIEMFYDWKAASERTSDGNIYKSIQHSQDRFNISDQLTGIFKNTADFLGYNKK